MDSEGMKVKMKDSDKKEKHRFRNMWKALSMELREHKSSFMVYFVLRLLVIIVMILQIFNQNYENVFLCSSRCCFWLSLVWFR